MVREREGDRVTERAHVSHGGSAADDEYNTPFFLSLPSSETPSAGLRCALATTTRGCRGARSFVMCVCQVCRSEDSAWGSGSARSPAPCRAVHACVRSP